MASTPSVCAGAMNNLHTCGQLSAHKNGYVMLRPTLRGDGGVCTCVCVYLCGASGGGREGAGGGGLTVS